MLYIFSPARDVCVCLFYVHVLTPTSYSSRSQPQAYPSYMARTLKFYNSSLGITQVLRSRNDALERQVNLVDTVKYSDTLRSTRVHSSTVDWHRNIDKRWTSHPTVFKARHPERRGSPTLLYLQWEVWFPINEESGVSQPSASTQ